MVDYQNILCKDILTTPPPPPPPLKSVCLVLLGKESDGCISLMISALVHEQLH